MRITTALLLVGIALLTSRPVRACSYSSFVDPGYPTPGAIGVPTDAVLWVSGFFDRDLAPVRLVDAGGNAIETTARFVGSSDVISYSEIVPAAPLAPSTTYQLVLADHLSHRPEGPIVFTTGPGPLVAEGPTAPTLRVEVGRRGDTPCGTELVACIAADEDVQLEVVEGSGRWANLARSATRELSFETDAESLCVEVRARDASGRASEPATVCSDSDAPVRTVPDSRSFLSCADGNLLVGGVDVDELPPVSFSGCSIAHGEAPRSATLVALLAALSLAAWRRRGR